MANYEFTEVPMFEEVSDSLFTSNVPVTIDDYFTSGLMNTYYTYRYSTKVHSLIFSTPDGKKTSNGSYSLGTQRKNTWSSWNLIPTARPSIAPPKVNTHYVEVPGFNGYLDYTEALSPFYYGEREGSISFYVMNGYGFWADRKRSIENFIHGKLLFMVMEEDPRWMYIGRWEFGGWDNNTDGICSTCTFNYHLQPDVYPLPGNAISDSGL